MFKTLYEAEIDIDGSFFKMQVFLLLFSHEFRSWHLMQELIEQINTDPQARRRGKYYSARIGFSDAKDTLVIDINNGQVEKISYSSRFDLSENSLLISASPDCWHNFLQSSPPPGFHDLSAMIDTKRASLSGNPMLWLSNSFYVKTVVNLMKEYFRNKGKFP